MSTSTSRYLRGNHLSARSIYIWRILQGLVWLAGLTIFLSLFFYPDFGLLVFWNILIPVAPLLLVLATGLWRNICPLATTALLPRHFNLSKKRKMTVRMQARLQLAAILLLYGIVPLRHAIFNTSGMATAGLLFTVTAAAITMGFLYDWKSGWCSTLCPVHPVERLYGGKTILSFPNAHCSQCVNCSVPCPDSTPGFHPSLAAKNKYHVINGLLTIGVLPGFIWGWFHVPDNNAALNWQVVINAYAMPAGGGTASLVVYMLLKKWLHNKSGQVLVNVFAAAAVSCYYWYRIPELVGFGDHPGDGLLIDLRALLPQWSIMLMQIGSTVFFFIWLVMRSPAKKSWILRPRFAERARVA